MIDEHHTFLERAALEVDTEFRQPIPYVLITNSLGNVALMRRMTGQGEARLHGKFYIGAGGHVEEGHTVFYTALKEVTEELGLPLQSLESRGVLITTGGPVEDVHLCIFYKASTVYSQFRGTEEHLQKPEWAKPLALAERGPSMERWSQVVLRDYLNISVA